MGIEVAIGAFGRAKRPMDVKRKRFHEGLLRYNSVTLEAGATGRPKLLEHSQFTLVHRTRSKPLVDRIFRAAK
jgi:hypothetical protein